MKDKGLRLRIGDIVWTKLNGKSHMQDGIRPAVIVQNNKGNYFSETVQVIPLTSRLNKAKLPTHVTIEGGGGTGLTRQSVAMCEGSRVVSKADILDKIGKVDADTMKKIAEGWLINNPILIFFSGEELLELQSRLAASNKTAIN